MLIYVFSLTKTRGVIKKFVNFFNKNYFLGMEPKFDYPVFAFRTKIKQREAAEKLGATTSLIGNYATGKAVPSYERIAGLIELGMTAQELFGKELGDLLIKNSGKEKEITKADVMSAVREALADLSRPIEK